MERQTLTVRTCQGQIVRPCAGEMSRRPRENTARDKVGPGWSASGFTKEGKLSVILRKDGMPNLYAIEITENSLDLITHLNGGEPSAERLRLNDSQKNYFIFDADLDSLVVPRIMTQREMAGKYDFYENSPLILRLK
jgi:hypothetical protein